MNYKSAFNQHPSREVLDNRLDQYFSKYVPASGACKTEGGELVRAMIRIIYRWYNDGDQIMEGYGRETCNAAARSILRKLLRHNIDIEDMNIKRILEKGYNCFGNEYDYKIYEDAEYLIDVLDKHPELFEMDNTGDMFSYTDSAADVDDGDWYDDEEEDDEEYDY